jgi:2-haloacid dehalogenase
MTPSAVYAFDAYGTLFDVHSAAAAQADDIGPSWERLSQLWRSKQLEYTWVRSLAGHHRSFWSLTEESLDVAAAMVGGLPPGIREKLLTAYRRLKAYPEASAVLTRLRAAGARTAILTNGDPDMIADAVEAAGLSHTLDAVITVHEAGVYKTAPTTYRLVTDRFGVAPGEVSFQSSNRWDIAGAKSFGFRCVWINRTGLPDEYTDLAPHVVTGDLMAIVSG